MLSIQLIKDLGCRDDDSFKSDFSLNHTNRINIMAVKPKRSKKKTVKTKAAKAKTVKKKVVNKKTVKKKAAKKKTAKKSVPKKAVKKASKKKTATKKKASTEKKTLAKKKTTVKKKTSAKKKPAKKTVAASPVKKKKTLTSKPATAPKSKPAGGGSGKARRSSAGALKTDTRVRVIKGNYAGNSGKIARHDPYLGTYFIAFEAYKNMPAYRNMQWGPYFPAELEVLKK
jgi:hypothetical protein